MDSKIPTKKKKEAFSDINDSLITVLQFKYNKLMRFNR